MPDMTPEALAEVLVAGIFCARRRDGLTRAGWVAWQLRAWQPPPTDAESLMLDLQRARAQVVEAGAMVIHLREVLARIRALTREEC